MFNYAFIQYGRQIPKNLNEFFKKNIDYMEKNSLEKKDSDIYWENVYYIYRQLRGLYDGYNDGFKDNKFDFYEFTFLTRAGDLSDITMKLSTENTINFKNIKIEEFKIFFYFIHIVQH